MIRAIITDLDRTLLRTDKTVSAYTLRVLGACREKGLPVMAATARPERAITAYRELIRFDASVTLNGAVVLLPGKTLRTAIAPDAVPEILKGLSRIGDAVISLETEQGLLANRDIPEWRPAVYPDLLNAPLSGPVYKILASSAGTDLGTVLPDILPEDAYFTVANGSLYQVMHARATKRNGVLAMLEAFGVSPGDAAYFGDDQDDIGPLLLCGEGVAVAGAADEVLRAADAVADSNDEDGVARYIESRILPDR